MILMVEMAVSVYHDGLSSVILRPREEASETHIVWVVVLSCIISGSSSELNELSRGPRYAARLSRLRLWGKGALIDMLMSCLGTSGGRTIG